MDSGWPAALLLAIVLLLILGPSCRALAWGRREDALLRAKSFLIFLGIVGVLAHNLADYNLQFVGIALPFTLLLGMLFSDSRGEGTAKENNKFVHVFELVVAGFLLLVAVRDGAFILTSSCGRFLLAEGDIPGALRWFRRADGEWFARDLHLTEARLLLEAGRADEAALAIQKYLSANTEDYRGWKLQGEIAEARGDVSLALTSYEEASVRGRMVDLGTVRHSVAALGSVEGREALDARRTDVDNLLMMYRDAILENRHFIALSKNVEEYMRLTDLLSSWYPALEPQYEGWAAAVDRRAKIIRAAWETKSPGALW
jgi:tetratricopeptide (TPR) repeat protein